MPSSPPTVKWKRVCNCTGPLPVSRHGHRAVLIKDLIVVFGGGNGTIFDDLHVFNTVTQQWFIPAVRGFIPQGSAAHGMACDGTRIIIFGGMLEYGKYSSEMYELQASRWEWKRLKPKPPADEDPPVARIGHSFTYHDSKVYLFGGLANETDDPKHNVLQYLNDLYILEVRSQLYSHVWVKPEVSGQPPSPRESHTANIYTPKGENGQSNSLLVIFGGMDGTRLGDLHMLKLGDELSWFQPKLNGIGPHARSLHVAEILDSRLYIFGGWTMLVTDESKQDDQWKVSKDLTCLNLETNTWGAVTLGTQEELCPLARAGHCSIAVHSRMYIWAGRDGYKKSKDNQVCFGDLWYLETAKPAPPSRVQLVQARSTSLEVCWGSIPTAEAYILQIQKYEIPLSASPIKLSGPASTSAVFSSRPSPATQVVPKVVQIVSQATADAIKMNSPILKTSTGTKMNIVSKTGTTAPIFSSNTGPRVSASLTIPSNISSSGSYRIVQQQSGATQVMATTQGSTKLLTFVRRDCGQGIASLTPVSQIRTLIDMSSNSTILRDRQLDIAKKSCSICLPPRKPLSLPRGSTIVRMPQGITNIAQQAVMKMSSSSQLLPRGVVAANSPVRVQVYPMKQGTKQMVIITQAPTTSSIVSSGTAITTLATSTAATCSTQALNVVSSTELGTEPNDKPPANLMAGDDAPSQETADLLVEESEIQTENAANDDSTGAVTSQPNKTDMAGDAWNAAIQMKHPWRDVAVVKGTTAMIMHYHLPPDKSKENTKICALVPGEAYKVRVAGINVCGRGKWSEVSAFKTCIPGFPSPPIGVKIFKHGDGAHISWDAPIHTNGTTITEYSVYIAVKGVNSPTVTYYGAGEESKPPSSNSPLAFVRVFYGLTTMCLVQHQTLMTAHVDNSMSGKPSLVFRLAAKNEKGYGAAVQVRWLLDPNLIEPKGTASESEKTAAIVKRTGPGTAPVTSHSASRSSVPDDPLIK